MNNLTEQPHLKLTSLSEDDSVHILVDDNYKIEQPLELKRYNKCIIELGAGSKLQLRLTKHISDLQLKLSENSSLEFYQFATQSQNENNNMKASDFLI